MHGAPRGLGPVLEVLTQEWGSVYEHEAPRGLDPVLEVTAQGWEPIPFVWSSKRPGPGPGGS